MYCQILTFCDKVVGLGKAIEGVLPKDEYVLSSTPAQATAAKTSLDEEMTAWPVREKRENGEKVLSDSARRMLKLLQFLSAVHAISPAYLKTATSTSCKPWYVMSSDLQ